MVALVPWYQMPEQDYSERSAQMWHSNGCSMPGTHQSKGCDTAESGQYANGTGNRIYKVVGPRAVDDVTIAAPYDPTLAATIESIWQSYSCEFITITVQPTTCDGSTSNGSSYTLNGCQLQQLTVAEMDRESGDVGTIELVFTVNSWSRG